MARVARPLDHTRIRYLKERIQDPYYLQGAVETLAGRITERLLGLDEETPYTTYHRSASNSKNDIASLLKEAE